MLKLFFKCKLLSDVVLTSSTATEGFNESLNYIPGNKFLGIAATTLYDVKKKKQTLDLFHNGSVRFGDAHLLIDGEYSYKAPFAWYADKLGRLEYSNMYLHHKLTKEAHENCRRSGIQLKQVRSGYINKEGTIIRTIPQNFSIKSAYDSKKRKSKDEQMYGYHSIPAGLEFGFFVEFEGNYSNILKNALIGTKKIGRSRTAEYGLVEISEIDSPQSYLETTAIDNNMIVIYAVSNICLEPETGQITGVDLGVKNGNINWNLSQVRTKKYQSYNTKRQNHNIDKQVIQKGSVFIVEQSNKVDIEALPRWVGSHQSEGLGNIAINPIFLTGTDSSVDKRKKPKETSTSIAENNFSIESYKEETNKDSLVLSLLRKRETTASQDSNLEKSVEAFFEKNKAKFKKIKKSQWGVIRALAKAIPNRDGLLDMLFHESKAGKQNRNMGYLRHGVSAKNWENLTDILKKFAEESDDCNAALIKLASKMQKYGE